MTEHFGGSAIYSQRSMVATKYFVFRPQRYDGPFRCPHEWCMAASYETPHLLRSHCISHVRTRTYRCLVKGCLRNEQGKGFSRKNEMIRHSLVHTSPGYVCPFCKDGERNYPRPHNLQRHVREHHNDKRKDDPLLCDVFTPPHVRRRRRRRRASQPLIACIL